MISKDDSIRATIAEQASEWFVAYDAGPLGAEDCAALVSWLETSPLHIEEFLRVSVIARDLRAACSDPEFPLDELVARAGAEDDSIVPTFWSRIGAPFRQKSPSRRWQPAAVALTTAAALACLALLLWNPRPSENTPAPSDVTTMHYETGHGEQQIRVLADHSVLHLNTDSAVTVRYSKTERIVVLASGEAHFEVAHEPARDFRVLARSAEVVDLGTRFDVRLEGSSTLVTVVEGRVAVRRSGGANQNNPVPQSMEVAAGQQINVTEGAWPAAPTAVDVKRATAWLQRQISFEREPLERVAAEFNRYAPKPIEITTPALRSLQVSGLFKTDDTEAFMAFLRSLDGVRVEVTNTHIVVSQAGEDDVSRER
jgi:transmembrane sensor